MMNHHKCSNLSYNTTLVKNTCSVTSYFSVKYTDRKEETDGQPAELSALGWKDNHFVVKDLQSASTDWVEMQRRM